ncbi:MAG: hypothetical protein PUB37_10480 [Firmicutes bacterium]|nr:hypothetical protein [Bacillota bacterium]
MPLILVIGTWKKSKNTEPLTWMWHNDYKEFKVSANWWKSDFIIKNFLYLRGFGKM